MCHITFFSIEQYQTSPSYNFLHNTVYSRPNDPFVAFVYRSNSKPCSAEYNYAFLSTLEGRNITYYQTAQGVAFKRRNNFHLIDKRHIQYWSEQAFFGTENWGLKNRIIFFVVETLMDSLSRYRAEHHLGIIMHCCDINLVFQA